MLRGVPCGCDDARCTALYSRQLCAHQDDLIRVQVSFEYGHTLHVPDGSILGVKVESKLRSRWSQLY